MRLIRLLKKDLAKEISLWVEQKLISADQARSICGLYDVDYDSIQSDATGYRLLIALGYLFIGLAVITLLGANWEEIPRAVRMGGLLAITVGTQGLGLWSYRSGRESAATGLFLLGNLFYGASIILIAQIYHLGEHMPDGVFWWALGSLPFGLLLRNTWLTLFSCLLALLWLMLEASLGYYALYFPGFIAAAVYVLIKGRSSALLFLTTAVSIGLWVEVTLSNVWSTGLRQHITLFAEQVPVSVALFVLAYAFGHWLHTRNSAKARDYGVLLSLWALRFGLITLLILSFRAPWLELINSEWLRQAQMWPIVLVLLAGSLWLGWQSGKIRSVALVAVLSTVAIVAVILTNDRAAADYFQVASNLVLIVGGIWLIVLGIQDSISHYFFLGIATILLVAFLRYIDLIGDYIGGAVMFIVMAGLLLGAAKYWKFHQSSLERS